MKLKERLEKARGMEFKFTFQDESGHYHNKVVTINAFIAQADIENGMTIKDLDFDYESEPDLFAYCFNLQVAEKMGEPEFKILCKEIEAFIEMIETTNRNVILEDFNELCPPRDEGYTFCPF